MLPSHRNCHYRLCSLLLGSVSAPKLASPSPRAQTSCTGSLVRWRLPRQRNLSKFCEPTKSEVHNLFCQWTWVRCDNATTSIGIFTGVGPVGFYVTPIFHYCAALQLLLLSTLLSLHCALMAICAKMMLLPGHYCGFQRCPVISVMSAVNIHSVQNKRRVRRMGQEIKTEVRDLKGTFIHSSS